MQAPRHDHDCGQHRRRVAKSASEACQIHLGDDSLLRRISEIPRRHFWCVSRRLVSSGFGSSRLDVLRQAVGTFEVEAGRRCVYTQCRGGAGVGAQPWSFDRRNSFWRAAGGLLTLEQGALLLGNGSTPLSTLQRAPVAAPSDAFSSVEQAVAAVLVGKGEDHDRLGGLVVNGTGLHPTMALGASTSSGNSLYSEAEKAKWTWTGGSHPRPQHADSFAARLAHVGAGDSAVGHGGRLSGRRGHPAADFEASPGTGSEMLAALAPPGTTGEVELFDAFRRRQNWTEFLAYEFLGPYVAARPEETPAGSVVA